MASDLKYLSPNFTWAESVITTHREIDNIITENEIHENIIRTASRLENVRTLLGVPIVVSSWYRNPALNTAVGGAKNSDHLRGCAVDFIAPHFGTCAEVAAKIQRFASLIGFKQLILEHTWVHISWDPIPNTVPKLEVLSLLSGGGYARGLTSKDGKSLA